MPRLGFLYLELWEALNATVKYAPVEHVKGLSHQESTGAKPFGSACTRKRSASPRGKIIPVSSSDAAQAKPASGKAGSDLGQGLILSCVAITKYLRLSHLQ